MKHTFLWLKILTRNKYIVYVRAYIRIVYKIALSFKHDSHMVIQVSDVFPDYNLEKIHTVQHTYVHIEKSITRIITKLV